MYNFNHYLQIFNSIVKIYSIKISSKREEENFRRKIIHSNNVKYFAENIAVSENFSNEELLIAQLCGQFHDIGRFEQYTKYHVFKDTKNQNHSNLALKIIESNNIFKGLSDKNKKIINTTILNHSKYKIDHYDNEKEFLFSKLLRDADKLDIFNILIKYYTSELSSSRDIAKEYSLSNEDLISNNIIEKIKTKTLINKSDINSINDMKIMQISWIFDINFNYSKEYIIKNKIINIILDSINDSKEKTDLINNLTNYL